MPRFFSIMWSLLSRTIAIGNQIATSAEATIKPAIHQSDIPNIPLFRRGKVRDVYDLGEQLLIVATDRISAFDCVLPNAIPDKGAVLTQMSLFWFKFIADIVPNHLITADVSAYPAALAPYASRLAG